MTYVKNVIILFCLLIAAGSGEAGAGTYDYPLQDKYAATIVGTPAAYKAQLPEKIRVKKKTLTVFEDQEVPEVIWYEDALNYSMAIQKGKAAPLIFVIAGTGASYDSAKMQVLQKAFYQAGLHVVCLSSPTHPNFIATASSSKMPGDSTRDAMDLYRIMSLIQDKLKNKVAITDYYLTGYSLGALESAFVARLDERQKLFNFQKVLMINPPVNLYSSVSILDAMLEKNIPGGVDNFNAFFNEAMTRFTSFYKEHDALEFNNDFLYAMYQENSPPDARMAAVIGLSFRISAANMIFTADIMNKAGYVVPRHISLSNTDSLTDYFKVTVRQSFVDYVDELLYPNILLTRKGVSKKQFIDSTGLAAISEYLKRSPKIGLVTNEDDLILAPGDLDFLKYLFQNRAQIYPRGGHCGNLDHRDNIAYTIDFFTK